VLGRIVAPYGVGGWVKVRPFGDDPMSWKKMPQWWLGLDPDGQDWTPYSLKDCKLHGKGELVAMFAEVSDRNASEAVNGYFIAVPRECLPPPEKDEYYWADLVGLEVRNLAGLRLGAVSGLVESGAHAVLQVQDGEVERLIPFVARHVTDVDMNARLIRVDWEADW